MRHLIAVLITAALLVAAYTGISRLAPRYVADALAARGVPVAAGRTRIDPFRGTVVLTGPRSADPFRPDRITLVLGRAALLTGRLRIVGIVVEGGAFSARRVAADGWPAPIAGLLAGPGDGSGLERLEIRNARIVDVPSPPAPEIVVRRAWINTPGALTDAGGTRFEITLAAGEAIVEIAGRWHRDGDAHRVTGRLAADAVEVGAWRGPRWPVGLDGPVDVAADVALHYVPGGEAAVRLEGRLAAERFAVRGAVPLVRGEGLSWKGRLAGRIGTGAPRASWQGTLEGRRLAVAAPAGPRVELTEFTWVGAGGANPLPRGRGRLTAGRTVFARPEAAGPDGRVELVDASADAEYGPASPGNPTLRLAGTLSVPLLRWIEPAGDRAPAVFELEKAAAEGWIEPAAGTWRATRVQAAVARLPPPPPPTRPGGGELTASGVTVAGLAPGSPDGVRVRRLGFRSLREAGGFNAIDVELDGLVLRSHREVSADAVRVRALSRVRGSGDLRIGGLAGTGLSVAGPRSVTLERVSVDSADRSDGDKVRLLSGLEAAGFRVGRDGALDAARVAVKSIRWSGAGAPRGSAGRVWAAGWAMVPGAGTTAERAGAAEVRIDDAGSVWELGDAAAAGLELDPERTFRAARASAATLVHSEALARTEAREVRGAGAWGRGRGGARAGRGAPVPGRPRSRARCGWRPPGAGGPPRCGSVS